MEADISVLDALEDNLKKALTELLLLHLISRKESYIGELTEAIREKSGGALSIVFPYSAIYRMLRSEFILESEKRIAPDGRRRQYYTITPKGQHHLQAMTDTYNRFINGFNRILSEESEGDA